MEEAISILLNDAIVKEFFSEGKKICNLHLVQDVEQERLVELVMDFANKFDITSEEFDVLRDVLSQPPERYRQKKTEK